MTDRITLGDHELEVFPQRHAYLTNRLGKYIDHLVGGGVDATDATSLMAFLGGEAYELLTALIPQYGKRCPRYEFLGYGSQEALDKDEYDEDLDKSPTPDEIITAFSVSARVQRFDTLKLLGKVVDPNLMRGWLNKEIAERLSGSTSLPSPKDGVAGSMSSGTTPPTSTVSTDSLSPASNTSKGVTASGPSETDTDSAK